MKYTADQYELYFEFL